MDNISSLDRSLVWHPYTPLLGVNDPIVIERAEGIFLITPDGRKIVDAVSSWWVNIHGHANAAIAAAISAQAQTLEHVIFAGFTHAPAVRLAQNLMTILPSNQSKIFYSDNGSTAVEVAIKMAFQYWHNQSISKQKVIVLDGAYHGDTFGAMSVGERGLFTEPFKPYLFDVLTLDFPDGLNDERIIQQFTTWVANGDVASFIYEPLVQGASGMRIYNAAILDKLLKIAHSHGVVTIADEVFTGFGRTGKIFASDYLESKPDIITLSKGITGGTLPLGVTSCSHRIEEAFKSSDFTKTFFHGHSYTANPIVCAAANASFELLMKPECAESIQRISKQHNAFIAEVEHDARIKTIKSLGTILSIELETQTKGGYDNELRKQIYPYFLSKNILIRPLGNVLYVLPPYIITNDELQTVYTAIKDFLHTLR
jgi:adenosylmethionine-8-amino-7-oxononanoate aminotransferase